MNEPKEFKAIRGKGVKSVVDSLQAFVGSRRLGREHGLDPAPLEPSLLWLKEVLSVNPAVFALLRRLPGDGEVVLWLHKVSGDRQDTVVRLTEVVDAVSPAWTALVKGRWFGSVDGELPVSLSPYQFLWLEASWRRRSR